MAKDALEGGDLAKSTTLVFLQCLVVKEAVLVHAQASNMVDLIM